MKHTKLIATGLALSMSLCLLAACSAKEPAETTTPTDAPAVTEAPKATEAPTEAPTAAPTEAPSEAPTEAPTEASTESPTEAETYRPTRDDWEKNDPENPYYNLIEVGTSYDGKTPCYDGRYDFGYQICHTDDGETFSSMQDALDWLAEFGGNITMDASPNVCLKLDIPTDGCFYRIAYWWVNCDFVMDYGVIYDDQNEKDGVIGYAYYSDLYELDIIPGLENTFVWILKETEGLAPGYYKMHVNDSPDGMCYTYEMVAVLEDWPGLPDGEILPD